jgi:hypothetical protein
MTRYTFRLIGVLFILFFAFTFKDYKERNKEHKRLCTVLKHYQSNTVHKSNVTDNFILILKVRNDTVFKNTFELDVSPSTYYDCKDNENWFFFIRNDQITNKGNMMDMFTMMSIIIGVFLFIGSFINFED